MSAPSQPGSDATEPSPAEVTSARALAALEPGERIVWAARPVVPPPVRPLGPAVGFAAAAVCLAVAAVSFRILARDPGGHNAHFVLIGLGSFGIAVVTLGGLGIVLGGRRRLRKRRDGSLYGLTERRAVVWEPGFRRGSLRVDSVRRDRILGVRVWEARDGSGDLMFDGNPAEGDDDRLWPFRFDGLPEVRKAEQQVKGILSGLAVGGAAGERTVDLR